MKKAKIFDYLNYKEYLRARLEALPKRGRGQLQRLAQSLAVHPTLVSQVLRGSKDFTAEQAMLVAQFFHLDAGEGDYLLALIERERAGNPFLKNFWQRRIDEARSLQQGPQALFQNDENVGLSELDRYEYYSSWEYSAIRLATSVEELRSLEAIAERLGITVERADHILKFLIDRRLCVEKDGEVRLGPQFTYLKVATPQYFNHAQNWRRKASEAHSRLREHEYTFTMPVSISREDRMKVRKLLLQFTEDFKKIVAETPDEEELCCFNVDWFDVRRQP